MKAAKAVLIGIAAVLSLGGLNNLFAQATATATQNLNLIVEEVNKLSITPASISITITGASWVVGQPTASATHNTSTYSVTTNSGTNRKITAQLDPAGGALPTGATLTTNWVAPTGGTSQGACLLSHLSAIDLVKGFHAVSQSSLGVTYVYTVTAQTPAGNVNRIVTFTLTADT